jgi:hypothetical protein
MNRKRKAIQLMTVTTVKMATGESTAIVESSERLLRMSPAMNSIIPAEAVSTVSSME